MGADFVCGVLAIKRGKVPNFEKARKWFNKMQDDELTDLVQQYATEFNQPDVEAAPSTAGAACDLAAARHTLELVWRAIKDGWAGYDRRFSTFDHVPLDATLLVAGGRTGGDRVEAVDMMVLFEASGMAQVAGFMV